MRAITEETLIDDRSRGLETVRHERGEPVATTDHVVQQRFYHGTKADLEPGDLVRPARVPDAGDPDRVEAFVRLTDTFDAASWQAELNPDEGPGRVYVVEPTGPVSADPDAGAGAHPGVQAGSYRSKEPLRVTALCTDGQGHPLRFYHGTKADLRPGDLIEPGNRPNFGDRDRTTRYVYLTGTLDAAVWGAELAAGEGPGRIYVVEPTGPIADDPNLTNQRYPGNPTKSYRSRESLRVTGECTDWQGHPPEVLQAMKDNLERMERLGVEPIDD